jgi:hypothetical protein
MTFCIIIILFNYWLLQKRHLKRIGVYKSISILSGAYIAPFFDDGLLVGLLGKMDTLKPPILPSFTFYGGFDSHCLLYIISGSP